MKVIFTVMDTTHTEVKMRSEKIYVSFSLMLKYIVFLLRRTFPNSFIICNSHNDFDIYLQSFIKWYCEMQLLLIMFSVV